MTIPGLPIASTTAATAALTPSSTTAATGSGQDASGSFSDALTRLVDSVDDNATQANEAVSQMLNKTGDVHDAMIALQRAEMSLQLTVQIRNKLMQAYQDVMRMTI